MEAAGDFGAGWAFHPEHLGTDRDSAIRGDFDDGALAEDVRPPRAAGRRPQGEALFLFGAIPGGLGSGANLAMFFQGVMVAAQLVQEVVGGGQVCDFFRPEQSGRAFLPELVAALDFSLA